jgi:serine/threonine-protein kinase
VFDYGRAADGTFYFVMEYLPGPTLTELVGRDGPLPCDRVVRLMMQLCSALSEAHAIGLVHRDIKPGNIIVCCRGGIDDVAKLLDFGLVVERRTSRDRVYGEPEALAGTPAFMSPEQAARQPADARSDVYSLGAVAYFALAGRAPFAHHRTARQIMDAHLSEEPPPLASVRGDVPANLASLIHRCLRKAPAERVQDAATLRLAMQACLDRDRGTREKAAAQ